MVLAKEKYFHIVRNQMVTTHDTSSTKSRNANVFSGLLKVEFTLIVHFQAAEEQQLIYSRNLEKSESLNVNHSIKISWSLSAISSETNMPCLYVGNTLLCLQFKMPCKEDILKQLCKPRHWMDKSLASFSHEVFKWLTNREYKEEKYMFQGRDLRRTK